MAEKQQQSELSAHQTRQAEARLDRRKKSGEDAHVMQIGQIIEENENFLRRSLDQIHLAKQHTILDALRTRLGSRVFSLESLSWQDACRWGRKAVAWVGFAAEHSQFLEESMCNWLHSWLWAVEDAVHGSLWQSYGLT